MEQFLLHKGYEILRPLGSGQFGAVYLVRRKAARRLYACKTAANEKERELLRREAEYQCKIAHPLFAMYEELLESEENTFLIMEYVEGDSLASIRPSAGHMECTTPGDVEALAISVGIAVGDGLRYLHNRPEPLLYRDLKPQHIILTPKGIKLLDLGCVCTLQEASRSRAGTRGYAAPEQLDAGTGGAEGAWTGLAGTRRTREGRGQLDADAGQTYAASGYRQGKYSDIYGLGQIMHFIYGGIEPSPDMKQLLALCTADKPRDRLPDMWLVLHMLSVLKTAQRGKNSGRRWANAFCVQKCICDF